MPRMPDYGRVTLPENITVTREHVQETLWEHFRQRSFYHAVPLSVNSEGVVTFQDPGKDKQKQLLSPFQEWELKNVLTDK